MKIMYYDWFTNTYVSQYRYERDTVAPPERYLKTIRGKDTYLEHYDVSKALGEDMRLDIAYSDMDVELKMVNRIRFDIAEQNRITHLELCPLLYWIIPANKFDGYYERFELWKDDENADSN